MFVLFCLKWFHLMELSEEQRPERSSMIPTLENVSILTRAGMYDEI